MRVHPVLLAVGVALGILVVRAPLSTAQPAITDSNYRIDLHQGPVLGSTRVIGLAGAYAAVAEGAVGMPFNPAAVAHREHYSRKWFDYDLSFDYLIPGVFQTKNFDMDGNRRVLPTSFHMFNIGGLLQFGALGVGLQVQGQFANFEDQSTPAQAFDASLTRVHITMGYALADHQLVLGGGLTIASFDVNHADDEDNERDSFSTHVPGLELGLLIRPKHLPLRFGVAASFAFQPEVSQDCGSDCPVGFHLPEAVAVPWQVRAGVAYRWGKRRFNAPFRVKKRARPQPRRRRPPPGQGPLRPPVAPPPKAPRTPPPKKKATAARPTAPRPAPPRPVAPAPGARAATPTRPKEAPPKAQPKPTGEYSLLVAAELIVTGKVKNAVGTDGFLDQIQERAGRRVAVSARLGMEAEVWKRRLRLRAGTYWEPSRFDGHAGRIHGTVGFALRLFDFKLWGPRSLAVSAAFDGAYQYTNLSLSIGFWH